MNREKVIIITFVFLLFIIPVYAEEKVLYSLYTSDNVLIRIDNVYIHDTEHNITNGIGEEGIVIPFSNQTNNYEDFYGEGNDSYLDLGVTHNISQIILYCGDGVACYYNKYYMFYGSDNPNTGFTHIATIPVRSSAGSYSTPAPNSDNPFGRYRYMRWRWSINGASVPDTTSHPQFDELAVYYSTFTLTGYVTNNLGNSVSAATITLNNSGGSTNSNDTGYYEITGIEYGTYTITATSPTHQDYSDTVSIAADTEKNISMTRLSPLLIWTDAETTINDVYLKWRRNAVVDNVRIYKDTETRLLTTVSSGSTLAGLYSDRNLDCDKGYVYWLQPMDNDVAGPKYRIDAKTDPCDGGGGGGGDPTPTPSPTATPGPTPPQWTNITQEEWLNLTLDQKQEILTNLTMFPPLLEFQWEDIYVWGIHLFLILCGAVALDSITIQKVSEYTGLWAIFPGVMFAYLTGYLVI